ncbi:hypothetical protein DVJ77_00120 [Dyella tabacisoli]|uniref:Uncharacterized protein n=1 Tax=Dyella tabacisoli TaxID=2282381 RepID=A0A369UXK2_9GAMM|nr:hypothetical protein DVJ77_00120 [Dyella tabacisoli]
MRRWQTRYFVSSAHPAPKQVQQKLDQALRTRTAEALAAVCARLLAADDASLVFIRRLDLEWHVDSAGDADQLARCSAQALGKALAQTLAAGESDNLIRFRDRAAYLARFIGDCAAGDAWQRWYYASFDGLRLLPASAAIRSVLIDEPQVGLAALLSLSHESALRILTTLTAHDAQRLLQSWDTPAMDATASFIATVSMALHAPYLAHSIEHRSLWLYLAMAAQGTACVPACCAVAGLIETLHQLPESQRTLWIDAFDPAQSLHGHVPATCLTWLSGIPATVRQSGLRQLAGHMSAPAADAWPDTTYTPFGGAFMLLTSLDAMALHELTRDWPDLEVSVDMQDDVHLSAPQLMRWLLLAHAQGAQRLRPFLADPVWRALLGIDARLSTEMIVAWLGMLGMRRRRGWLRGLHSEDSPRAVVDDERYFLMSLPGPWSSRWHAALATAAQHLLHRFACKIPGFATSRAHYLHSQFLDAGAQLEWQHEHVQVTLERPPLALLLNLAGLNRGQRELPWLTTPAMTFFSRE